LVFSTQTAVNALELDPQTGYGSTRARQLAWDGGQHLTRGWLGSRMPTQYVNVRADKSERKLELLPAPGGDASKMALRNRLGVDIKRLVCRHPDGKLYFGEAIGRDKEATLAAATGDVNSLLVKFSGALAQNAPAFPGTMSPFDSPSGGIFMFGRRRWYLGNQQTSVDTVQSRLEMELAALRAAILSQSLPPGTYVAIVERPAEIEAGLDGLTESQSLHVICGTW
jgi:hypothetical protein